MSQKLSVNNLDWIEDTCHFNKDFIKSYNEESDKRCLVSEPNYHTFHIFSYFILKIIIFFTESLPAIEIKKDRDTYE